MPEGFNIEAEVAGVIEKDEKRIQERLFEDLPLPPEDIGELSPTTLDVLAVLNARHPEETFLKYSVNPALGEYIHGLSVEQRLTLSERAEPSNRESLLGDTVGNQQEQ